MFSEKFCLVFFFFSYLPCFISAQVHFLRCNFPDPLPSHPSFLSLLQKDSSKCSILSLNCTSFFQRIFFSLKWFIYYEINYLTYVLTLECELSKKRGSVWFLLHPSPQNLEQCLICSRHSQMFMKGGQEGSWCHADIMMSTMMSRWCHIHVTHEAAEQKL